MAFLIINVFRIIPVSILFVMEYYICGLQQFCLYISFPVMKSYGIVGNFSGSATVFDLVLCVHNGHFIIEKNSKCWYILVS